MQALNFVLISYLLWTYSYTRNDTRLGKIFSEHTYSVLNKRPPPCLLIFRNFFQLRTLFGPPAYQFGKIFCFRNYKIFKSILSMRGILTNFSVPELYWRRKLMNNLRFRHKEHKSYTLSLDIDFLIYPPFRFFGPPVY